MSYMLALLYINMTIFMYCSKPESYSLIASCQNTAVTSLVGVLRHVPPSFLTIVIRKLYGYGIWYLISYYNFDFMQSLSIVRNSFINKQAHLIFDIIGAAKIYRAFKNGCRRQPIQQTIFHFRSIFTIFLRVYLRELKVRVNMVKKVTGAEMLSFIWPNFGAY